MRAAAGDSVGGDLVEENGVVSSREAGAVECAVWDKLEKSAHLGRHQAVFIDTGCGCARRGGSAAGRKAKAGQGWTQMDCHGWINGRGNWWRH